MQHSNRLRHHIAIDLDDVILDFMGGVLQAVETEFGITIDPATITKWDIKDVLDPLIGRSWWSWLEDREWLWANFPAVPGAIGSIERLRRDGHYLEIVTSKPRWAEHNVWKWLGKWRPAVNAVTIVGPKDSKPDWTAAEILIDDRAKNVTEWVYSNDTRTAILFSRPHNASYKPDAGVTRADSWHDIMEIINGR